MAKISPYAFFQEFDNNGDPLAGGLLYTYEAGTTTPKATYTDNTEDTANANPVVLDANGRANVWLESGAYKFVLKTSADVTVKTVDNVVGEASNVFGGATYELSSNTLIDNTYQNSVINCTASLTLSLLAAATAQEGFLFTVKNTSAGNVTIDPNSTELIDGAATLVIAPEESAMIICTGTAWQSYFTLGDSAIITELTTTDIIAKTSAGGSLDNTGGTDCASWGGGGGQNFSITNTLSFGAGGATIDEVLDEDDMSSDSATKLATQQSIKAYVDGAVPASAQLAKAWVNFNGTGTVAIRDSYNVSSITDNGVGDYTVNFSTAMPNANYTPVFGAGSDTLLSGIFDAGGREHNTAPTVNLFRMFTCNNNSFLDLSRVYFAAFGD